MAIGDAGDDGTHLVSTTVDPGECVPLAVLRAIAAVDDEPIEELPQLYETIDPDALAELVDDDRFEGTVAFEYDGYRVLVDGNRDIEIFGVDRTT